MQPNDDKLKSLLKRWRDVEPRANFEANVWRRIRASRAEQGEKVNWIDLIGRLLWQPAWSLAAALAVGLVVGIWGGIVSVPHRADSSKAELQFLAPGTLAGSYLQMGVKETR
jgi:hypothetical protein